jgi:hypothetical protein
MLTQEPRLRQIMRINQAHMLTNDRREITSTSRGIEDVNYYSKEDLQRLDKPLAKIQISNKQAEVDMWLRLHIEEMVTEHGIVQFEFISEATPVRQTDNLYFNSDLKNKKLEKKIWKEWFEPFFKIINENSDVIKAFSYINSDWSSQPMWVTNPTFNKVDSRIQVSTYVSRKWKEEMEKSQYLKASDVLWDKTDKN